MTAIEDRQLRRSGIATVGDIPWGTHLCQFYQTPRDLVEILVPWFREGLAANEFCMWVTSEPLAKEEAAAALRSEVSDLDERIRSGQMEILDYAEWYTKSGRFDSNEVLEGWTRKLDAALERGYEGLRVTGNTFWLERAQWDDFRRYEETINSVIGRYRMLALCTYSLERCGAGEIMDVMANHRCVLVKRDGRWQSIQAAEHVKTERALRDSEERWATTLASIGDAVIAADTQGVITFMNGAAEALTGWTLAEAAGRPVTAVFRIINEDTRAKVACPVEKVLREGSVIGLANHTVLIRKDGTEAPIDDSGAPIRGSGGEMTGVVLVFRDITERRRAERALRESEEKTRRKLGRILSPESDTESLGLEDIVDAPAIQALMNDFHALTRIPMSIADLNGRMLVSIGWQDICTRFHRAHPEAARNCTESDLRLSEGVPAGEFRLYKCRNGMWDIATPIVVRERQVGNVFVGQFFFEDEAPDYGFFRAQAARYGFDEKEYMASMEAVPRLSRKTVDGAMAFLIGFTRLLSETGLSNFALARSLAQSDALRRSLEESSDRLNRSQEISHLGSWELDLAADRLSWSDEVYRLFGLAPQEFQATYEAFLEAVHPDDRAAVDAAYSGSVREGKSSYEIRHRVIRQRTGEVRWVHEKCEHVKDEAGKIVRSIGMVLDITERKAAEDGLRRSEERYRNLSAELERQVANRTSQLQALALALTQAEERERQRVARVLHDHLQQLLAAAKIGVGALRFSAAEGSDMADGLTQIDALLRESIESSRALTYDLSPPVLYQGGLGAALEWLAREVETKQGLRVRVTRQAGVDNLSEPLRVFLFQAARELLFNIAKHAGAGNVDVSLATEGTQLRLCVADDGKGFDPAAVTPGAGGGFGLFSIRERIGPLGGDMEIDSAPGRGTRITLYAPITPHPKAAKTAAPASRRKGGRKKTEATSRGPLRVIVADDHQVMRKGLVSLLSREADIEVVGEAGDGMQLLESARKLGPDIVVVDVSMPILDGIEATRRLRDEMPHVQVIGLSMFDEPDISKRMLDAGASAYLTKSGPSEGLLAAIRACR